MSDKNPALAALAQRPPELDATAVAGVVRAQFGLRGEFAPLVSERDLNFELRSADGGKCVVKVTSAVEAAETTEFHTDLLRHLQSADGIRTPRVLPALDGQPLVEIASGDDVHKLRVVSWVQGEQLESLELDVVLARRFGAALADLDLALRGWSHPGDQPVLLWDLQRVSELRELLDHIGDASIRAAVVTTIDDFDRNVVPACPGLRTQVIHGDANPENVLVSDEGFGFIDFSDSIRAPLIVDVAIAASYLRSFGGDPLEFILPFVAGYQSRRPLEASEIAVLFDLVRARLATTITLLYWRQSARSESDAYRQKSQALESDAAHFLAALDALGRANFTNEIKHLARF
ncbi:MAG: phosphotransferase [Gammaproteobacteria bacterium]|nr:phosphotransferase [Gammaproteobacteria bacterium]